jgi:hypothetical protein
MAGTGGEPQHYAFLISEADFDAVFGRIQEQGIQYWADPRHSRPGEINMDTRSPERDANLGAVPAIHAHAESDAFAR